MKKLICLCILPLFSILSLPAQQVGIQGTVSNARTGEALAYATLIHIKSGRGTATNNQGAFVIPYAQAGDSIRVSYIGFELQWVVVGRQRSLNVKLRPKPTTLNEVVINSDDNDFLYALIAKARRNAHGVERQAKTYFFLETFLDNQHTEIIEAYFNGQYEGYRVEDLAIKKGRIGIRTVNDKYFISTESSRAFILHNPFQSTDLYPDNPLVYSKARMKNKYNLELIDIYTDEDARIYVVDCQPKGDSLGLFRTKLWIDVTHQQLAKTQFTVKATNRHPFYIIGYQKARDVDMDISRTYERVGKEIRLASVDFTYKLGYKVKGEKMKEAFTRAYLKVYDYEKQFPLPFFEFSNTQFKDYRNITVAPYHQEFWDKIDEFRFYDRIEEVNAFMENHKLQDSFNDLSIPNKGSQLPFGYVSWRSDRILMRDPDPEILKRYPPFKGLDTDRYDFNVKLYLDASFIHDSLVYQLNTIIDPVGTRYDFIMDDADHAFINMHVDLMEIEKRKLARDLRLKKPQTMKEVQALYWERINLYNFRIRRFENEALRGRSKYRMEKWNEIIKNELEIDNLIYFPIQEYLEGDK